MQAKEREAPSVKRARRGVIALIVGILFLAAVGGLGSLFVSELHNDLVHSCENSGNPLKRVVQAKLREEIAKSAALPPSYLPDIPPMVFHKLIAAQIEADRRYIREIEPSDCESVFQGPL